MPEVIMTVGDVAERYRVSVFTVYKLVQRGQLHAHKVGSQPRFYPEEVETFLRENRAPAKAGERAAS